MLLNKIYNTFWRKMGQYFYLMVKYNFRLKLVENFLLGKYYFCSNIKPQLGCIH